MVDPNAIVITTRACTVTFHDTMHALLWARILAHQFAPEAYVLLQRALHPGNIDLAVKAQHMVDLCFGAST